MKKVIIPLAFLFVLAFSSCKTSTTTETQENVDSLKQVEDVIATEVIDTASAISDTLEVTVDSTVAE